MDSWINWAVDHIYPNCNKLYVHAKEGRWDSKTIIRYSSYEFILSIQKFRVAFITRDVSVFTPGWKINLRKIEMYRGNYKVHLIELHGRVCCKGPGAHLESFQIIYTSRINLFLDQKRTKVTMRDLIMQWNAHDQIVLYIGIGSL